MDKQGNKLMHTGEAQAIWEEKENTEIHMTTTGSPLNRGNLEEYAGKLLSLVDPGDSQFHDLLGTIRNSEGFDRENVDREIHTLLAKLSASLEGIRPLKDSENYEPVLEQTVALENLVKALVAKLEKYEVIALLDKHVVPLMPIDKRNQVVDMASGIGRFLKYFSSHFKHIVEVDFIKENIEKAKELNRDITNSEYIVSDVRNISFPQNTVNLIFGNWILQYIDDEEIVRLLSRLRSWLVPGGLLFFHEGIRTNFEGRLPDKKENPAIFRESVDQYNSWFDQVGFEIVKQGNLQTYDEVFGNPYQIYWVLKYG